MRVGVVDLGTNSTRLLVADVDDGRVEEVARRLTITRLGEGVDERRKLLPLPIARVRNVLSDYRRELEQARRRADARDRRRAPSATPRTARRSSARSSGATASPPACSRATRRRELTRRGVAGGQRARRPERSSLDVGGGSTELIVDGCAHEPRHRLCATDRAVPAPPIRPRRDELDAAARAGARRCSPSSSRSGAIGVAGTVTTLAALELGELRPRASPRAPNLARRSSEQLERLASLPLAVRRALPGLEPERAPVIVGGRDHRPRGARPLRARRASR